MTRQDFEEKAYLQLKGIIDATQRNTRKQINGNMRILPKASFLKWLEDELDKLMKTPGLRTYQLIMYESMDTPQKAAQMIAGLIQGFDKEEKNWSNEWTMFCHITIPHKPELANEWGPKLNTETYLSAIRAITTAKVYKAWIESISNNMEGEFNVDKYFFCLNEPFPTDEELDGKIMKVLCCDVTLEILKKLSSFNPTKEEFEFFEETFSKPHPIRCSGKSYNASQMVADEDQIQSIFLQIVKYINKLERKELQFYFLNAVEVDLNFRYLLELEGKPGLLVFRFMEKWKSFRANIESQLNKSELESNNTDESAKVVSKINWLGTQKELAELFVELKKKGWIDNFNYSTIKACFTKSDSIQQTMKPAQDVKTKELTFDQIYTPQYKAKFYGIPANKNKT